MTAASFWSLLEPAFKIAFEQNFISHELNFILIVLGFLFGAFFVYLADLLLPSITSKQIFHIESDKKTNELKWKHNQDNSLNFKLNSAARSRLKRNLEVTKMANLPVGDSPIEEIKETPSTHDRRTRWHRLLLLIIAVTVHNFPGKTKSKDFLFDKQKNKLITRDKVFFKNINNMINHVFHFLHQNR